MAVSLVIRWLLLTTGPLEKSGNRVEAALPQAPSVNLCQTVADGLSGRIVRRTQFIVHGLVCNQRCKDEVEGHRSDRIRGRYEGAKSVDALRDFSCAPPAVTQLRSNPTRIGQPPTNEPIDIFLQTTGFWRL